MSKSRAINRLWHGEETCPDSATGRVVDGIMLDEKASRRWLVRVLADRVVELYRERRSRSVQDTKGAGARHHDHESKPRRFRSCPRERQV